MRKEVHSWYSHRIGREMPIAVYGHFGFPLLMFPTAAADFEEYERFHLIGAISHLINAGKVKVYAIDSVNRHTWMASGVHPGRRAYLHEFYDQYVTQEVAPFIWNHQGGRQGIITTGASVGAYHAVNFLLRHPDIFSGTIAMSGSYDLSQFVDDYMDHNVYINSPLHYVPNMHDHWQLTMIRDHGKRIHVLTGQGPYEAPHQSRRLSTALWDKGVWHNLDLWGHDMRHDWPTWRLMLPHYLETRHFG
ncbi:MAG: alpha/beta hydrolase-fold protein [Myxococcota bacterium]